MTARSMCRSLTLAIGGIAATPALAAARPPGPGGDDRMATALFAGIGDPLCAVAALLVLGLVALGFWSRERNWRLGAVVLGVLSVGLGIGVARVAGGQSAATLFGIVAGLLGVLSPALQAGSGIEHRERATG
jgi:hypothetical protein